MGEFSCFQFSCHNLPVLILSPSKIFSIWIAFFRCSSEKKHMSSENHPCDNSIESWLANGDGYFMAYYNPYIMGLPFIPPLKMNECHLKRDHVQKERKVCLPTSNQYSS